MVFRFSAAAASWQHFTKSCKNSSYANIRMSNGNDTTVWVMVVKEMVMEMAMQYKKMMFCESDGIDNNDRDP